VQNFRKNSGFAGIIFESREQPAAVFQAEKGRKNHYSIKLS